MATTQTIEATDHKLLVAGDWIETGEWSEVASPYDGSTVGRVSKGDAAFVDRAIAAARAAFEAGGFPQHERAAVLDRAADLVARARGRAGGDDRGRGGQADQDRPGRGAARPSARSPSPRSRRAS